MPFVVGEAIADEPFAAGGPGARARAVPGGQRRADAVACRLMEIDPSSIPHITLAAKKYNNDFSLIVEDSGKGMNVEEQERMFDPFFTTRKTGTGLGLAVSHQIIEQHNGRFEVESSPEQGTRIVIILPQKIEEV